MRAFCTLAVAILAGAGWWAVSHQGQADAVVLGPSGPQRPSRHAAPPDDFARINRVGDRRVPAALRSAVLTDKRPMVFLFLAADCGCSKDFVRMVGPLEPILAPRASCLAVIAGEPAAVERFVDETGTAMTVLGPEWVSLAAEWGVEKAGVMALVRPDGLVEAVWPGISRQGFRDLAVRLGDPGLFPEQVLKEFPGAATAGCPLPIPMTDPMADSN